MVADLPQFPGFIAFFVLAQDFGDVWSVIGFNTHAFLIMVSIGGAAGFNAFLLKGFLDSVPKSLDEAARIDGAGQLTIFFRIILLPDHHAARPPDAGRDLHIIIIIGGLTTGGVKG